MLSTPFKLVLSASLIMLCVSACSNHSTTHSTTYPTTRSSLQTSSVSYDHTQRTKIKIKNQKYINQYQQAYIKAKRIRANGDSPKSIKKNTYNKTVRYQHARNKKYSQLADANKSNNRHSGRVANDRPSTKMSFQKVGYYNHQRSLSSQNHGNQRNTWSQIHKGFRFSNYNHKSKVRQYVKSYARMPKQMSKLSDRSSKYLPTILAELQRRQMPTEIALLPFVESAFNTRAYSPAKAAGLWQFIPATARRYGLSVSSRYDARYNWKASTHAALDYLQDINRQFHGDWLLTLAAYNCGETRVLREIAANRARGRSTDFWSLNLPRETRNYVPRLLAFKEIYSNPRAYGVDVAYIPTTTNTRSKSSRRSTHRTQKNKGTVTHRVKMGDTLYQIAKRYNTSVHKIMRLNGLKSTKIRLGKRLKIASSSSKRFG